MIIMIFVTIVIAIMVVIVIVTVIGIIIIEDACGESPPHHRAHKQKVE